MQAAERLFAVLEAVGSEDDGVPVARIQELTGLPVVTVYRLLRTLHRLGYAEPDVDTGRWHVGLRVLELRGRVSVATRLATLVRPFLKDLMLATGARTHLALFRNGEVVYIDTVRDLRTLDTYWPPGQRKPAHCTALGKVFLAALATDQLARVLAERGLPAFGPRTITTAEEMARELATVRARGYATEADEAAPDSRCVAAGLRDYTERIVAAISVSSDAARLPDDRLDEVIDRVIGAAQALSRRLGSVPAAETSPEADTRRALTASPATTGAGD
jgi:IclR family acetate operon transcriptional repressor